MYSNFEDSDVPLYDWNSDDEPPSDILYEPVITSIDGTVSKRIIQIGKYYDKPGLGDIVSVQWVQLNPDDLHHPFIQAIHSETPSDLLTTSYLSSFRETVCHPIMLSEIGYDGQLPYGIEMTLRTMKTEEMAIVFCPFNSLYTSSWGFCFVIKRLGCIRISLLDTMKNSYTLEDKNGKYHQVHPNRLKKKRTALKQSKKYTKTKHMLNSIVSDSVLNETVVDDNKSFKHKKSNENYFVNSDRFETKTTIYIVYMNDFKHRFALTDDRSIIKEIIQKSPPYRQSPRIGDSVYYYWSCLNSTKDPTQHLFNGQLTYNTSPLREFCHVLLGMREGEISKAYIRTQHNELTQLHWETTFDANMTTVLIVEINLVKVLRCDLISLPDNRIHDEFTKKLQSEEIISRQLGIKQQLNIELGCRIAAFLTVQNTENSKYDHDTMLPNTTCDSVYINQLCPFEPLQENTNMTQSKSIANLITWTVGLGVVPVWLDTIIQTMQPGKRIKVLIPKEVIEDSSGVSGLWPQFLVDQGNKTRLKSIKKFHLLQDKLHNDLKENTKNNLLSWTKITVGTHNVFHEWAKHWVMVKDLHKTTVSATDTLNNLNIIQMIEKELKGKWDSKSGSVEDMMILRDWIEHNSTNGYWCLQNYLNKLYDKEANYPSNVYTLDIQTIDVLERVMEPWMFTDEERFDWAHDWKEFGNYLFKNQLYSMSVSYYTRSIEMLRFSKTTNGPLPNVNTGQQFINQTSNLIPIDSNVQLLLKQLYSNMSQCYLVLQEWYKAIDSGNSALAAGGTLDVKINYRLALAYYHLEKYEECKKLLSQCQALNPTQREVKILQRKLIEQEADQRKRQKQMYTNIFSKTQ